jgi:hypothetical protein
MSQHLALAAAATVLLALVHALVPALRAHLGESGQSVVAAIGGGVAAAYVFVHLLPELARGNRALNEALGDSSELGGVGEIGLFAVALAGFLALYGLDHLAIRADGEAGAFAVHLGVYTLYNAVITYSLPTQFRADVPVTVLFVVAMAVHFLVADRSLARHHGRRFATVGRPVLAGGLVVGFLLAWVLAPTRAMVVSVLLAVLGGFILYVVFSDELPDEDRVRFPTFALSAGGYAGLLLVVTALQH